MLFAELSEYLEKLEQTSSRIEITKILADLFKNSKAGEIDKTVYLILGTLAPSYKGIVFNLAERMMLRIIAKAYEKKTEDVAILYKQTGDLGFVAEKLNKGRGEGWKVGQVYASLAGIARDSGEKSQERKINETAKVLSSLDPLSARYVARIPVGRLRLGFSDKTILDALSWMEVGDKSKKPKLEKAYQVVPDVGLLAKKVKEMGIDKASRNIKPVIGIPVLPMLAQRIKSPNEMIKKMGKVFVEPKFDGLRVLIHYKKVGGKEEIKAFTRNLNNVIDMFSELKNIDKYLKANEVILDAEAVGMDPDLVRMANFQTTMQRRRKYDIEEKAKSIPLRFQVFDIIFKNGVSLMDKPYFERREILKETIVDDTLLIVDKAIVTDDPEVINREYREKIKAGLEGVMVKKYDTPYFPGRTGWRWVKMKMEEASSGKLADTVDCVVMGYSAGRGKRVSFGVGQFLVGIVDGEATKTVTKVGTGLTDNQFRELKERLSESEVKIKPKNYLVNKILEPDFWVNPSLVVEIAADEITKSPTHTSGFALRFPRLVRFRDDKSVNNATSITELKKLYRLQ
jgi:DNA ligase 1